MKKILLLALCALSLGFTSFLPQLDRDPKSLIRYFVHVPMSSPYAGRVPMGWLRDHGYDIAGFNWQAGTIEVITDQDGIKNLTQAGFQGEARQGLGPDRLDPNYLNPQKVEAALKALNTKYPTTTALRQIGVSLQGRPIWAMLISSTPNFADGQMYQKPSIIFDGLHHAREVMSPEIVLDVAQTLLAAASEHSLAAINVLQKWNVWVVPMLNVDGSNLVWSQDTMWRKNARADRSSVYGVDINRNYPFKWNSCHGSSTNKDADDFHGAAGASEPETMALMQLGAFVQPTASLSYHSYGELVLYPYGCQGVVTGENVLMQKIGNELAGLLPSDSGRGHYTPGTPWQILYSVDGDSMSYMYSQFGAVALTFEVNQDFQPAYSTRAPTLVKHRQAWQYFINRLDSNLLTIKIADSKHSGPASAVFDINTMTHSYGEQRFHTNPAGNFFKVLDPGQYAIRVTTQDGRTQMLSVQMNGQPQTLQVNF